MGTMRHAALATAAGAAAAALYLKVYRPWQTRWGASDETHTLFVTRMRDEYRWSSPVIVTQLLVDAFDFPFMRKVLLGIKARAEHLAGEHAGGRSG